MGRDVPLRGCPTCETPVDEIKLGLRDFSWVNPKLPGNIGGMDVDFCLTQVATGRVLMIAMMDQGYHVSTGERLTYGLFVKKGFDVLAAWDQLDGTVKFGWFNRNGRVGPTTHISVETLAEIVVGWWTSGNGDD